MQSKAVVAGDEINAADRQAALMFVQIATAANARGDFRNQTRIAAHKAADNVPVTAVPFAPAVTRKTADLVQAGRVPGFGDQLGPE